MFSRSFVIHSTDSCDLDSAGLQESESNGDGSIVGGGGSDRQEDLRLAVRILPEHNRLNNREGDSVGKELFVTAVDDDKSLAGEEQIRRNPLTITLWVARIIDSFRLRYGLAILPHSRTSTAFSVAICFHDAVLSLEQGLCLQ